MYRLLNSSYKLYNQNRVLNQILKTGVGQLVNVESCLVQQQYNGCREQYQRCHVSCSYCSSAESQTDATLPSIHRKLPDFLIATEFVCDVLIDGIPIPAIRDELVQLGEQLESDGAEIVKQAMIWQHEKMGVKGPIKSMIELSVVLCNENEIRKVNKKYREIDSATDVLSFRTSSEEDIEGMPIVALGDVIICAPIASVQAKRRRYELLDEMRVLLVHGVLHLLGYDHDKNDEEWDLMSEAEQFIMAGLGWKGQGLIEAQGSVPIHEASELQQKAQTVRVPLRRFMRSFHTLPAAQQPMQTTSEQQQQDSET